MNVFFSVMLILILLCAAFSAFGFMMVFKIIAALVEQTMGKDALRQMMFPKRKPKEPTPPGDLEQWSEKSSRNP